MSIVKIPTEVYRYRPLSTRNHTRVLELQSAKAEDVPLCCALREVDVETEDCIYEALSYTWGEPIFSHKLFVEGELIKITPSLAGALRRFRLQEKARSIWADAVCINQQNDEEKSVQIPMMSSIYCNAHRVLVWYVSLGGAKCATGRVAFPKAVSRAFLLKSLPLTSTSSPLGSGTR
jgi:hypothetical protein